MCALCVCGIDWLLGTRTTLLSFAELMVISGIFWWSIALMMRSWKAMRDRRIKRLYVQSLRDLHTADQHALKKRYFDLTGRQWPD